MTFSLPSLLSLLKFLNVFTETNVLSIVTHVEIVSKVLVVITDKGSGLSSSDIEKASEPLHNRGIKVVPVAVGTRASPSELVLTNPERFVIEAPRNENPQSLGQQIMEHVVRRKSLGWHKGICDTVFLSHFACSINPDREARVVGHCAVTT